MKLAKLGYGSIQEILDLPVNLVIDILDYETFLNDWEAEYLELNKS